MAYYRTCPYCGAALDPGEHCDCGKEKVASGGTSSESDNAKKDTIILTKKVG